MEDHGLAGTRIYSCWKQMHQRCYNPENQSYPYYGGRGIGVCHRWSSVFNFLEDMGHPPKGMSIDRKDNNADYSPDNCHWVNQEAQNSNTRRNRYLVWDGREQTIKAWAKELDLNPRAISDRLRRGWSIERALTTPTPRKYEEGRRIHNEAARYQWELRGEKYRANALARRGQSVGVSQ